MVLKHQIKYCDINETSINISPVFKEVVKNLSPYIIYNTRTNDTDQFRETYNGNREFFNSFIDTLTNYAPISINIIDYWNKHISDNHVLGESRNDELNIDAVPTFVIEDGSLDCETGLLTGKPYGKGYNEGAFIGCPKDIPEDEKGDGSGRCATNHRRFFINSMIGVQDKLAKTYMNSFYKVLNKVKNDSTLRHRLFNLAAKTNQPVSELFKNTNEIFSEERSTGYKQFLTKKGTPTGLLYAGKTAYDAKIQGNINKSNFNMNITSPRPFEYMVEASILPEIFEKFIKPLAHPIGMIYEYKSICIVRGTEDVDRPLIHTNYSANIITVICRCRDIPGDENNPNKDCDTQANFHYTIATKNGKGLWSGLGKDETKGGNILVDFQEGTTLRDGVVQSFKKYILKNNNFLIRWERQGQVDDIGKEAEVMYYRFSGGNVNTPTNYTLVKTWKNDIHCNIYAEMKAKQESQISEEFEGPICIKYSIGKFAYLDQGQGTEDGSTETIGVDSDFVYRNFDQSIIDK